jgi:hypothetical protein
VPNGLYDYKVTLDNWAAQEEFNGFEECTRRDPSGQFVNRFLAVSTNLDLPQFCFNSCYACGEEVKINFKLGMNGTPPSPDGVWLCGGGNFDVPGGKYKMNDSNNDGIFEITVPRKTGFQSYYAFANGACPDFSCKENLTGQPCGDPANFNDRFLAAVNSSTTVATCFQACFTNAECVSSTTQGIEDEQVFRILGNPAPADAALLQFGTSVLGKKEVILTNSIGQAAGWWQVTDASELFELPIQNLPSGVYFVHVQIGERYYTRKLVK